MRKYVIVDYPVSDELFQHVIQNENKYLRVNTAEDECILKYTGNQPSILTGSTEHSLEETHTELLKSEWEIE